MLLVVRFRHEPATHARAHEVPNPEAQSEPMEDDELEMDVDEDAEGEEGDDIDVVGDGTHDDEGVVDDKDVVEEDIEDELIDVRPTFASVSEGSRVYEHFTLHCRMSRTQMECPLQLRSQDHRTPGSRSS